MPLFSAVGPFPVNRIKNRLFDPDARDYILRVEAADGERLESQVRGAINDFVLGCKADGIWSALTNACIMAGARSVAGAIVPLIGNAPTNNNFISGDYNRKTGLIGDGSTKSIQTAYNNSSLPTDNDHISCYVTQIPSVGSQIRMYIGTATGLGGRLYMGLSTAGLFNIKNRTQAGPGITPGEGNTTGFKGHSRNSSTNTIIRSSKTNTTNTTASTTLISATIGVFASGPSIIQFSDARMSFYSLGTNIDLALLDTRITTLMDTLARVIS